MCSLGEFEPVVFALVDVLILEELFCEREEREKKLFCNTTNNLRKTMFLRTIPSEKEREHGDKERERERDKEGEWDVPSFGKAL